MTRSGGIQENRESPTRRAPRTCQESASEKELQGKLHVSGSLRTVQQPQRTAKARIGRIQDRRVCQVDRFGPELQLFRFRKIEEFAHAEVESMQARAANSSDPACTKGAWIFRSIGVRVEPLIAPR